MWQCRDIRPCLTGSGRCFNNFYFFRRKAIQLIFKIRVERSSFCCAKARGARKGFLFAFYRRPEPMCFFRWRAQSFRARLTLHPVEPDKLEFVTAFLANFFLDSKANKW